MAARTAGWEARGRAPAAPVAWTLVRAPRRRCPPGGRARGPGRGGGRPRAGAARAWEAGAGGRPAGGPGRGAGASGRAAGSRRREPPPTRSLRGRSCSLPGATVTQHACQVGPRPDGSHYLQLAFGVSRAATGVVTGLLSSVNSLFLLGPLRPGVGGPARCASDFFIYTSRKT